MSVCDIIRAKHNNGQHLGWIYQIDSMASVEPYTLGQVRSLLATPGYHGLVATEVMGDGAQVPVGYALYQFVEGMEGGEMKRKIVVRGLVVHPHHLRRRVGSHLFAELVELTADGRWPELVFHVLLRNQGGLAFLKALNDSVCDGHFGKFRLVERQGEVVQFTFSPCPVPA